MERAICVPEGPVSHRQGLSAECARSRSFKRIKERSGVREDLCFHDLRHTCATLLLREGVNVKVVSEMLGHASITITLNIYAHVLPDMQDSAANAMEAALGGVL
jgi:integrase